MKIAKKKYKLSVLFLTLGITLMGQTLDNGIELPEEWPPRYSEPTERGEMPVPYLKNKPEVLPINLGRQLFVDDFLVSDTDLGKVYHKPRPYSKNPILEPTEEWEKTSSGAPYAAPFSDGIWYDEIDQKYKMWYLTGAKTVASDDDQGFVTAYAESKDGKTWEKPTLDVLPGTNIVDTNLRDAATVWLDKQEKDASERYKFFNVEKRPLDGRWQYVLKYSSDGIHWSKGVAQSGDMYDRSSAFYNPFINKWALSMRYSTELSSRSRSYAENNDPEKLVSIAHRTKKEAKDQNVVFWFVPDDKEPRHPKFPEVDPGIYNFDAISYESIMLGFYTVWEGPSNEEAGELGIQKRNEVALGYSRDGFHFSRPTHEPFLEVNETDGAWNWGNVQSVNGVPLIVGDSLYFYNSGRRLNDIMWDSYMSTGLSTLRRDGFVSMRAEKTEGQLLTEKLSFDGKFLFVNADVKKGRLLVEVVDENGKPVEGYTKKDSRVLSKKDSTKYLMRWKNHDDLSELQGKPIKLKFYLTNGDLYSFWISPWETGESRGYTGGGGPGLSPTGIDEPLK